MSHARLLAGVVPILLLTIGAPGSRAATSGSVSPGYTLSAWASETGTPPGDVFAITQDLAGYLWLGTPTGLLRFDGTTFVPWSSLNDRQPLPNGPVNTLITTRSGSLWIGLGSGNGVARIDQGHLVRFDASVGAPAGAAALLEDREGTIWAASRRGLFRFKNNAWSTVGRSEGYPGVEAFSLLEDRLGRLWVGTGAGVYRRNSDAIFEGVNSDLTSVRSLVEDRTGAVWVTDTNRIVRRLDAPAAVKPADDVQLPASGWRLMGDRRGQVWVATFGGGLLRMVPGARGAPVLDRFHYEQRLPGSPRSLYEDRDGSLWVGMRGGLLRLSAQSFDSSLALEGLTHDGVRTMVRASDDSIWIATGHALNRFANGRRDVYPVAQAFTLHVDHSGDLWTSTAQGLGRIRGGRYDPVKLPMAIDWSRVAATTADMTGTAWLCSTLAGVMAWDGSTLHRFNDVPDVAGRACQSILTDSRNRVWIGFQNGGVAIFDRGSFQVFGENDGVSRGTALAMTEDRSGNVWLATSAGVSRFSNGRITAITAANAPLRDLVPVLTEDGDGYIWVGVNSGVGVVRFNPNEVDRIAANRAHQLEYTLYDETDGMQPIPLTWQAGVGAVRASDGRLWITSGNGVTIVDPHRLPPSRQPPPPHLEGITADGHGLDLVRGVTVPSGANSLQIAFATVSVSSASKLRFRYRLDGYDRDWIYPGQGRVATYTQLNAGEYRFRVSATHGGDWVEAAPWDFFVAPPFYRTLWFAPTAVFAIALLVAAAWWLRLRAIRQRYALVFAERARVSREIHDTLLQSLAALGVELEVLATQLDPSQGGVRDALRRLRREVGHSVRDARESILELRRDSMATSDLATALRELADRTARVSAVQVEVSVAGKRPPLWSVDLDLQLLRIAQEAVANAVRHGRASEVIVLVNYELSRVTLTVRDNGSGFNPEEHIATVDAGAHLGLITMRERAARLRGQFHIASRPGNGTSIEASIPLPAE